MMGLHEVEFYGGPFCGTIEKVNGGSATVCVSTLEQGGHGYGFYILTDRVWNGRPVYTWSELAGELGVPAEHKESE